MSHRYPYEWRLSEAKFTKDRGKVFSCFACGGGSTMGYKLAGFDVIGCNEIDPRMMEIYRCNHSPKLSYLEPIQTFKERDDLPRELYELDILDGSPPCSTFSMAGVNSGREKSWGKMKLFREGQAKQILDTLFFDFIDLAEKLQPKVIIAENVRGLLLGAAKRYVQRIYAGMTEAGYQCQHFVLNAQTMGVPQRRERVFFIALRNDLVCSVPHKKTLFEISPMLNLNFNEPLILFSEVMDGKGRVIVTSEMRKRWEARQYGDGDFGDVTTRLYGRRLTFNTQFAYSCRVCGCLTGKEDSTVLFDHPRYLSQSEVCRISSFPLDFDFGKEKPHYVCGMSVPPVMMANIATEIYSQWLSKIK